MDNSVQSLAGIFKVPPERLIELLSTAGVADKSVDDSISFAEKQLLINMLKTGEFKINQPAQKKELEVQDASGRKKTIVIQHRPSPRRVISRAEDERRKRMLEEQEAQKAAQEAAEAQSESTHDAVQETDAHATATEEAAAADVHSDVPESAEETARVLDSESQDSQPDVVQEQPDPAHESSVQVQAQPGTTGAAAPDAVKPAGQEAPAKKADDTDSKGKRAKTKRKAVRKNVEVREKLDVKNRRKRKQRRRLQEETKIAAERDRFQMPTKPIVHEVPIFENNKVSDLASVMSIKAAELIGVLMRNGIMATINDSIDADTATLAVDELGHKPVVAKSEDIEEVILSAEKDDRPRQPRPPVVAVMGHVDHGKTTLLDYIRRTKVAESEKGGITQRIGAYQVDTQKGTITFLDTPGHEAFAAMRVRGASVADIVILVVAGDDGVKPQTVEAISHAVNANVPIVVAVNKMDKSKSSADRVCNDLTAHEIVVEPLGGNVQCVNISALKGTGVDELLDAVMAEAEVRDFTAPKDGLAQGVVIESKKEVGRGPVASVLVQGGTVRKGDIVVSGVTRGRARVLTDDRNRKINAAGPSEPLEIVGLDDVPIVGDSFVCVADEKVAQKLVDARRNKAQVTKGGGKAIEFGVEQAKELNLIVKTDVFGSAEALSAAMTALSNEKVEVKVIHSMVGPVNQSDVHLAETAKASIIAFNVKADSAARQLIDKQKLQVFEYGVIYDAIDEIGQMVEGIAGPSVQEHSIGIVEVREVYKFPKIGTVAGCYVSDGAVRPNLHVRVLRDEQVVHDGLIESLKRFKSDVPEVKAGQECGISVRNYNDIKQSDKLEIYQLTES